MAKVITTKAVIVCEHQGVTGTGTIQPSGQSTLKVDDSSVLVKGDIVGLSVTGCTNNKTNLGQKPCTKVVSLTAGEASKLRMAGDPLKPVLLDTATGPTDSTPQGTWNVQDPGQTKLNAS